MNTPAGPVAADSLSFQGPHGVIHAAPTTRARRYAPCVRLVLQGSTADHMGPLRRVGVLSASPSVSELRHGRQCNDTHPVDVVDDHTMTMAALDGGRTFGCWLEPNTGRLWEHGEVEQLADPPLIFTAAVWSALTSQSFKGKHGAAVMRCRRTRGRATAPGTAWDVLRALTRTQRQCPTRAQTLRIEKNADLSALREHGGKPAARKVGRSYSTVATVVDPLLRSSRINLMREQTPCQQRCSPVHGVHSAAHPPPRRSTPRTVRGTRPPPTPGTAPGQEGVHSSDHQPPPRRLMVKQFTHELHTQHSLLHQGRRRSTTGDSSKGRKRGVRAPSGDIAVVSSNFTTPVHMRA
jgi:hypothetical protein